LECCPFLFLTHSFFFLCFLKVDCGADLTTGFESAPVTSSMPDAADDGSGSNDHTGASPNGGPSMAPLPLDTRTRFAANLFLLSGIELAHVIMKLEQQCPHVLEQLTEEVEKDENSGKAISPKLEVNIDAIEPALFEELSAYVLERVGSKGHSDVKVDHVAADVPTASKSRPKKKRKT